MTAADFDGDGTWDVIHQSSHGISLNFTARDGATLPGGRASWKDLNADGIADAASVEDNGHGHTVWTMLREPGGRWSRVAPHVLDSTVAWVLPVDLLGGRAARARRDDGGARAARVPSPVTPADAARRSSGPGGQSQGFSTR